MVKQKKKRPPRIMLAKNGRPYVLIGKKRVYLKVQNGISNKQLVNVVINNFKKQNRNKKKRIEKQQKGDTSRITQQADYLSFLNHTFLNKKEDAEKLIKEMEIKSKRKKGIDELKDVITDIQKEADINYPKESDIRYPEALPYSPVKQTNYSTPYKNIENYIDNSKASPLTRKISKTLLQHGYQQGVSPNLTRKLISDNIEEKKGRRLLFNTSYGHPLPPLPEEQKYLQSQLPLPPLPKFEKKYVEAQLPSGHSIFGTEEAIAHGSSILSGLEEGQRELKTKLQKETKERVDESIFNDLVRSRHWTIKKLKDMLHNEKKIPLSDLKNKSGQNLKKEEYIKKFTNDEQYQLLQSDPKFLIQKELDELKNDRELSEIEAQLGEDIINFQIPDTKNVTQRNEELNLLSSPFPSGTQYDDPAFSQFIEETDEDKKNIKTPANIQTKIKKDLPIIDLDEDDEENQTQGSGKSRGGLYDDQLKNIMHRYKNFEGVYPIDRIKDIPVDKNTKKIGFIMNLDHHNQPGSHWVSVFIDKDKDKALEYYDSFGDDPPKEFMKNIKYVINKMHPDTYLKFKINRIVQQSAKSNNCGLFAAKFLMDRFENIPFKDCTKYNDIKKGEAMANKMRDKYQGFGYI